MVLCSVFNRLKEALAHPLTRGLNIDDPETTFFRRAIVENKPFLKLVYQEWFTLITEQLGTAKGAVVELGSGAGFLDHFIPGLITSEVFQSPGIRIVFDGQNMPFRDASLKGIAMTNVMHHIPSVEAFLRESARGRAAGSSLSSPGSRPGRSWFISTFTTNHSIPL
jgi:hypothetical protein